MAKHLNNNLYRKLVKVTEAYLGPSAERFVDRQITNHLNKPPNELTAKDLAGLIDWLQVTVSLLTDNTEIVEEYGNQLKNLANGPTPVPSEGSSS